MDKNIFPSTSSPQQVSRDRAPSFSFRMSVNPSITSSVDMGSFCRNYMWCLMVLEQILHKLFVQLPLLSVKSAMFKGEWGLCACSWTGQSPSGMSLLGSPCASVALFLTSFFKTHQPLAFRLSEEVSCDLELVAEKGFPLAISGFSLPSLEHPFCNYNMWSAAASDWGLL